MRGIEYDQTNFPLDKAIGLSDNLDTLPLGAEEAFNSDFFSPYMLSQREEMALECILHMIQEGKLKYDATELKTLLNGSLYGVELGRFVRRQRVLGSHRLATILFRSLLKKSSKVFQHMLEIEAPKDMLRHSFSFSTKLFFVPRYMSYFQHILLKDQPWDYYIVPIKKIWVTPIGLEHRLPQYYDGTVAIVAFKQIQQF